MVIPKKIGNYSFELDDKTIKVNIQKDVTRVSKMDLITRKRNTGGYENITSYKVTVIDGGGNVVKTLNTSDESEYFEFMNSLYCSNSSFDPQNLFNEVYKYINSKATIPIGAAKIVKIGDNFIKAVYPFECFKDDVVDEIITNLTNMGCTVKQLKDKKIRSFNCKVFSILIPKTIKLKENITMNKKLIRLTESDLHRIVKESVNKLLKEVQLNELDPRTYASYAAKRQAQGQTNKAKEGEDAAIQAWNKQYGKKDTGTYSNVDDYGDRERIMRNNPYDNNKYEVRTQYTDRGLGHLSTYKPTMDYNWDTDTEGYETQGKGYRPSQYLGIDDKGTRRYARREQSQQALQGYEVAKQMANNSGKYIKGKGWQ